MHRGGIFFSLPFFIIFHASAWLARAAAALSKGLASSRDKNCRGDPWEIRQVGCISQSISGFYNFGTKCTLARALQKRKENSKVLTTMAPGGACTFSDTEEESSAPPFYGEKKEGS